MPWGPPVETDSPAWVACYILREGPRGVPTAQLDMDRWAEFAAHCAARGYRWNGVFDTDQTKLDAVAQVLEVAHASLARPGGRYSVIWNGSDAEYPLVQVFTPRITSGLRTELRYEEPVDLLRVAYVDPGLDWSLQEAVVYGAGHSESDPGGRVDRAEPIGVTSREQAERYGRFTLALREHRPRAYVFQVGLDALVCTRGDRVGLVGFGFGGRVASGRVAEVIARAADFSDVRLDSAPPADAQLASHPTNRQAWFAADDPDAGVVGGTAQWVGGGFDDPEAYWRVRTPADPGRHRLLGLGMHLSVQDDAAEHRELRVSDIQFSIEGFATVTATDWAVEELHRAEEA